jgi:hypothetical protein
MTPIWLALCRPLTLDKYSPTLLSTCRRYETTYSVCSEIRKEFFGFVSLFIRKKFFEYLNELRTVAHRINDKESSLIAWESTRARESGESKQSVPFDQVSEPASKARSEPTSSMSKSASESASKALSMRWSTYSHRSTNQWIDLPRVSVQLVSLLQRRCQCDDLSIHIALPLSEPASMTRSEPTSSMS